MADYLSNFARSGDPNGEDLPEWKKAGKGLARVLHIGPKGTAMGRASYGKLTINMLTKGDPKG